MASFYVYIVSDKKSSTFAPGFTANLVKRVHELKNTEAGSIAEKGLNKLVYFEKHTNYAEALKREKEIKDWDSDYLRQIIILQNPKLKDLFDKIF